MEESKKLSDYEIDNGTILYLVKQVKYTQTLPAYEKEVKLKPSVAHNKKMCSVLKTALLQPLFKQALENLATFEKRENLIAINAELRDDPSIFGKSYLVFENQSFILFNLGVLGDFDLLCSFLNKNNIKQVLKKHPIFLDVATNLAASFVERMNKHDSVDSLRSMANPFPRLSYSIDALSDEDDDEDDDASWQHDMTPSSSRSVDSSGPSGSSGSGNSVSASSLSSMLMQAFNSRQRGTTSRQSTPIITQGKAKQNKFTFPNKLAFPPNRNAP